MLLALSIMKSYSKPSRPGRTILILIGIFCYQIMYSQNIKNVDFSINENKITVTYDLFDCASDKAYDIKLFYFDGSRYAEATSVTGNLYKELCGSDKSITWDVLNDRSELKGNIHVEVRIAKTYSTIIKIPLPQDKGYFGVLMGVFGPIGSFGKTSGGIPTDDLEQGGVSFDLSYSYRFRKVIGITSTFRYSDTGLYNFSYDETTWYNFGFTVGPLFSFPLTKAIVWDIRPMIGYSQTYVYALSDNSVFFNDYGSDKNAGGLTTNLGTAFRFNMNYKTNLLIGMDYFITNPQFDNNITRNIKTLGFSFGLGIRFN